ncbi:bridging integrator 3 homolog [Prorops nasuta]|uniref:bridging integrator 3 homolog n=1 Tax=Prorops nasuta TaxID=863751 RepID=UPI0034CE5792
MMTSWLKKNHLTVKPTPAPPLLSLSEDRDLDTAVQRLIYIEEAIRKLIKEMKKYLKAITSLDTTDRNLSTNLTDCILAQNNDEFRKIIEEYHSVTTQAGKNIQEMETLCKETFIEPLRRLRGQFELVQSALMKREELVNVWKASHVRLKKLEEKKDRMASTIAKLEKEKRAEETAGKELKALHTQLLKELPLFLEKRLEYIKPSVHALIMIELEYYGQSTQLFAQLMPTNTLKSPTNVVLSDEEYEHELQNQLSKIKSLTIVKSH